VAVIETPNAVAVCFDAPTVELLDTRAVALHPQLSTLGPDLLAPEPDLAAAVRNLASPERADTPVGEAILDQSLLAGLGNVYRSEVLFLERVDPFLPLGRLAPGVAERLVATGARLIRANRHTPDRVTTPDDLGGAPGSGGPRRRRAARLHVYGRAARPCPRCGTPIRTRVFGDLPRRVFWCPSCQAPGSGAGESAGPTEGVGGLGSAGLASAGSARPVGGAGPEAGDQEARRSQAFEDAPTTSDSRSLPPALRPR
jgi:endonuclease-8